MPAALLNLLEEDGAFRLDIINVGPHMHLLGREIRMDKVSASGEKTPMIYVEDWEFDWQDIYTCTSPVPFHRSDRMEVSATYDNSADNPLNPHNPPIAVGWGDGTTDEMCVVYFTVVLPDPCSPPIGLCSGH